LAKARERLGDAPNVALSVEDGEALFDEAGFADFAIDAVGHAFVLPSFDAYYGPFERGGCSTGQGLAGLSEDIRRAVREEVRRDLGDTAGRSRRKPSTELPADSAKLLVKQAPYLDCIVFAP
jgi:hypothetical protein